MNWFWLNLSSSVRVILFGFSHFDILWMSRPRHIETGKFIGCRDWDSSETETFHRCRDWDSSRLRTFLDVRPKLIDTGKFLGCRDWDSSRLGNLKEVKTKTSWDRAKRCRYQDSIETLADLWVIWWGEVAPFLGRLIVRYKKLASFSESTSTYITCLDFNEFYGHTALSCGVIKWIESL